MADEIISMFDASQPHLMKGSVTKTRSDVLCHLRTGMKGVEIAKTLGISTATVSYHTSRLFALGLDLPREARKVVDWEEIQADFHSGVSIRQIAASRCVTKRSIEKALSRGQVVLVRPNVTRMSATEYADHFGERHATPSFRRVMLKKLVAIRGDACQECELTEWRGGRLPIELDHIDGDTANNAPANLRILCCNCHSQTPTFRGRNVVAKKSRARATLARGAGFEPARLAPSTVSKTGALPG